MDALWDWTCSTNRFWGSENYHRILGRDEVTTDFSMEDWEELIHPEDRARVTKNLKDTLAGESLVWGDEYRFLHSDGRISEVVDRGKIIRDEANRPVRLVGALTDVTVQHESNRELARANRALHLLSACNETLIRSAGEREFLADICRHAVEIGGCVMAWVGYAREDARQMVEPIAWAGREEGFLTNDVLRWAEDDRFGKGPAGRCLRGGRFEVCGDLFHPDAAFFRKEEAAERGYRSSIYLPLIEQGKAYGFFGLFWAEPLVMSDQETTFLRSLTEDLAFGISHLRNLRRIGLIQSAVLKVSEAARYGRGVEFYDLMLNSLADALGGMGGLIGKVNVKDLMVSSISWVMKNEIQEPVTYSLVGTPCEDVYSGEIRVFPHSVKQRYPEDEFLDIWGIEAYAGIPLRYQSGEVAGILVVLFDEPVEDVELVESILRIFSARIGAELDRHRADERIVEQASLLDKARDAIFVCSLDHTITYWNKGAERLYGWSAVEAIGQKADVLLYPDSGNYMQAYQEVLKSGEWVGEMRRITPRGAERVIEGRWNLVKDDAGNAKSIFAINTDVTEHHRLEQQFIRAQRLESIGTMAGGLAHDLNNILAPVSMAAELLKSRLRDDRNLELLNTITDSAKRGSDMIERVISFSRGMEGRRVGVDPKLLISEIVKIGGETFFKGMECKVSAGSDLWVVRGDPTQLHQVLLNLCLNARDAVGEGGSIHIAASNVQIDESFSSMVLEAQSGPHVCVSVEDHGTGIPPEMLDRIFDPFFTTKSVGKGTGLGLSITMAIVKSHGGFIRVKSVPGEGTCFRVYLPATPGEKPQPAQLQQGHQPQGKGSAVLIVDDEESIREITRKALESYGYRARTASGGREALVLCAKHADEIAVVIMDMMMPGMSGGETIELLAKNNPDVKVIAVSGMISYEKLVQRPGVVKRFLAKPYHIETLLEALAELMVFPFET
ncbi:MAG: PAS domain-containing protein [Luteolibacter sp.]